MENCMQHKINFFCIFFEMSTIQEKTQVELTKIAILIIVHCSTNQLIAIMLFYTNN